VGVGVCYVLDYDHGLSLSHSHTHQLSYYDSKQEGKCHGTIPLSDIQGVEEAEPTSVGKEEEEVTMEPRRRARSALLFSRLASP